MTNNLLVRPQQRFAAIWLTLDPRVFVWSVWLVMTTVNLILFLVYMRNLPVTEDWLLVPPLTGNEPDLLRWAWEQNNEHRVPLPKLVLLILLKLSNGDFRVGALFNMVTLSLLAALMILTARKLREDRTSFADAFFPVILLHLGHWENLFWSWQISFILPVLFISILILLVATNRLGSDLRTAMLAGICVIGLPLCGAVGLLFVPPAVFWLTFLAMKHRVLAGQLPLQQSISAVLLGSAFLAVTLTVVYFVGYERPSWTPPNPGLTASLITALEFLALGLGPVARITFPWSIVVVSLIVVSSLVLAVYSIIKEARRPRIHAAGLLVFFLGTIAFAMAMGWGRAGVIAVYGSWPLRYVLLASLTLIVAFYLWEIMGPRVLREVFQTGLFLILAVLVPVNTQHGTWWRDWYVSGAAALEADVEAGSTALDLAERHKDFSFHSMDANQLGALMWMLKIARIDPFSQIIAYSSAAPLSKTIKYYNSQADEVFLVWGINGWQLMPRDRRPSGTFIKNQVMHTPMELVDGAFSTVVELPSATSVDFGFLITRTPDGRPANTWDADGDSDFSISVLDDRPIIIHAGE